MENKLLNIIQVVQDIKDIKIQGATNIAKSAFEFLNLKIRLLLQKKNS